MYIMWAHTQRIRHTDATWLDHTMVLMYESETKTF